MQQMLLRKMEALGSLKNAVSVHAEFGLDERAAIQRAQAIIECVRDG